MNKPADNLTETECLIAIGKKVKELRLKASLLENEVRKSKKDAEFYKGEAEKLKKDLNLCSYKKNPLATVRTISFIVETALKSHKERVVLHNWTGELKPSDVIRYQDPRPAKDDAEIRARKALEPCNAKVGFQKGEKNDL